MKENEPIKEELLTGYLLEELSAEEKDKVNEWINSSSANKLYLEELKAAWSKSGIPVDISHIDEEKEWNIFKSRIKLEAPQRGIKTLFHNRFYMRVAAIFVLISGIAIAFMVLNEGRSSSVSFNSGRTTLNDTLPDGSGITLNKNSVLSFRSSSGKREVDLKGEAFFNVIQDKLHPFIIHADNIEIRVLGTSFNVKTTVGKTEIVVETGAVQVLKGKSHIELISEEKLTASEHNTILTKKTVTDKLYKYYRTRKFECNGTPLRQLVEALSSAYDQHIVISGDKAGSFPITAVFSDQSLDEILRIVCGTLQLKAVKRDNDIILQ